MTMQPTRAVAAIQPEWWATSTDWPLRTARRPGGQQPHQPDAFSNHRCTAAERGRCDRGPVALQNARQRERASDNLRMHCAEHRARLRV